MQVSTDIIAHGGWFVNDFRFPFSNLRFSFLSLGVRELLLGKKPDASCAVDVVVPGENGVGFCDHAAHAFGVDAGVRVRFHDRARQKAHPKAGLHQLHCHGGIIAVADDAGLKAVALALAQQVLVVAPQIVASQQAHRHVVQQLDGHVGKSGRGVGLARHDQRKTVLAEDALVKTARLGGGAQKQRVETAAVELGDQVLRRAEPDVKLDLRILFVEAFDKKTYKGNIGFFTIQNNKVSDFELLIDNNFHMSYPMVWRSEQNEYFMIPESEENGTIDLYQSEAFPRRWKRLKTLVAGVHYADTTLLDLNGKKYLFTYHDKKVSWDLLIYDFDAKSKSVSLIQTLSYDKNACRPAGKFFIDEKGRLCRPVQNCQKGYGNGIFIYEVKFEGEKFSEQVISEFDNRKIKIDGVCGVDNFHTYTMTDEYEVIDFIHLKFKLLKKFFWQVRKFKRWKRHH